MKKIKAILKPIIALGLLYFFLFIPIPFYIELPGSAFGLDDMVEVDHRFSDEPGDFYITTVAIQQATPFTAFSSILPFRDLLSESELFGDVENFDEYDTIQQYYMNSSINTAIQVAFDYANQQYELEYNGVYVLQVLEDSAFFNQLKVGDTVKATDGVAFESSHDFIEYISSKEVGETVEIEYDRDGEIHSATGELILLDSGVAGIGIGLVDNTSLVTNPEVTIHSGAIGGPSAGLMFSLQVYKQLMGKNIHGDYDIAGTGTISPNGEVGRIGGIAKKVVASDEQGADYFFAPDDEIDATIRDLYPDLKSNYEEALDAAEAIDTNMKIIPVKTFQDALDFLESLELEAAKIDEHVQPKLLSLSVDDVTYLDVALP